MANTSEFKLDNGVTVIYKYVPNIKIVSVQSWIKTGSVNEDREISGISHFLEHILFKGTKNFKADEIDAFLDGKGGYNNAFTSTDVTNYYVTIPTKEVDAAFKVVSEMVFNALFLPKEIEKEKPVVLQEINRKYDDPSYKMWQDFMETLFKGTPYEMQVIGTPETVKSLNQDKLKNYYNKFYHPENMVLVVVGDIEKDEVEKLSKKYFSVKRDVSVGKSYDGKNKLDFNNDIHRVFKADVNIEYAILGYATPPQTIETIFADEVLSEILSGGEYSLLNDVLKNQKNIVMYVSDMSMFNKYNGIFGVYAAMEVGKGEIFKKETLAILDDIKKGKIDKKRLEKAKNRLKSHSVYEAEKVSSLANNIGFSYILDVKDYYLNYEKGIDKVTLDDVVESAKRLTKSPLYFGETIPKGYNNKAD